MNRTSIFRWAAFAVLVAVAAFYAVSIIRRQAPGGSASGEVYASPMDAVYSIDGNNVRFGQDGVKYFGNPAVGDLDGDGDSDTAFLFTRDAGGSGTFFYVAAALKSDAGYVWTDAVFLGDRIAPQPTTIMGGQIVVNYAERKAGEPMTARPSMGVSRYFYVTDGRLMEKLK